ncbi:MAG: hypothetical protein IJ249_03770 [Paludibacteraceae bacterium]|nr:hypothetical protein [Paludibacteraceae bacterium]
MKKNIKVMVYGLWMMVVLFVSTPLTAQNAQEWQSTSTMQGSGSAYSSQVTAVGATGVAVLGASSSAPANAASRPHREQASGRNAGDPTTGSNQSPPRRCTPSPPPHGGKLRALYRTAQAEKDSVIEHANQEIA